MPSYVRGSDNFDSLAKEANKKFPKNKERQRAYIYGTLQKIKQNKKE